MDLLDQQETIRKVDRQNMADLIQNFSDQMKHAAEIGNSFSIEASYGTGITNIVFSGLGGSAIGADLVRSYLHYSLPIPVFVNRHYRLPKFVGPNSLFIVSSYSGDTEETLASLEEGIKRKAKVIAITSGGELARLSGLYSFPLIRIPKGFPPRAALGYSAIPLLVLLSKIGFKAAFQRDEAAEAQEIVRNLSECEYRAAIPTERNLAKQLARRCFNRYPIIYGSADYFDAVALRWRGQIEENAKNLASHHVLPEMNHNELVGWQHPKGLISESIVLMLRDRADHERVQKRMSLTKEIIERESGTVMELWSQGNSLLARMFSLVHLGDWFSFYLAVLNEADPTPVRVIQYLKGELAKAPAALK
jgi:glucose/mannose-6-phosphate isomerase